jgi:HK97 family phage major capsid protein
MNMEEVKTAVDTLGTTFEAFKNANDLRLKEIETKGNADPLLEKKVDDLNIAIDDAKAKLDSFDETNTKAEEKRQETMDRIEATIQRIGKGGTPGGEVKSAEVIEHEKGFISYMRKGLEDGLPELQEKALSVGVDSEGGYLVPQEISSRIITKVFETTPMRQLASVETISGDSLDIPRDYDEATSGGWVGEKATRGETDTPDVGMLNIPAHEQYAEPRATQKSLDDIARNLEQWLAAKIGSKFARIENTAFISSAGVASPRGILTYTAGTGDRQIEQISSGSNGAVTVAGLISLQTALFEEYQANASWLMGRALMGAIRKLKGTDVYWFQPSFQVGAPSMIMGRPVFLGSDMPVAATNSLSIVYADFREGYTIVDRTGIRTLRDPFTAKPFVKFYTTKRTGGAVTNEQAIKIHKLAA